MADTARLDAYADWIRANQDKAGSPEFVKVADAYRQMREQQQWETERPAFKSDAGNAASSFVSGVNKGFFDVLGAPSNIGQALINKVDQAFGFEPLRPDQYGSGFNQRVLKDYGMVRPTHGWDSTNRIGEGVGTGLATTMAAGAVAPAITATRAASGMPVTGAKGVLGSLIEMLGPRFGGSAAKTIGGETAGQMLGSTLQVAGEDAAKAAGAGDLGQTLAGIGTSAGIPLTVLALKNTAGRGVASLLSRPDGGSGKAYDTLVENGITPTPGLVGGSAAARMENAATYVPFFKRGEKVRTQSFQEFQDALRRTTDDIAGRPGYSAVPTDPPTVGARFQDNANTGLARLEADLSREQNFIENTIGPQTLVPVDGIVPQIKGIAETSVDGQPRLRTDPTLAAGVENEISRLNQARVPEHAPLHGLLQTEIAAREAVLGRETPGTNSYNRVLAEIEQLRSQSEANQKVPYEAIKDIRTQAGYAATPNGPTAVLGEHQIGQARDTYTGVMRDAADNAGILPEFDAAAQRYTAAHSKDLPLVEGGDIPYLDKLRTMGTGQEAYNNVMGEGKWERADVLRRNNPEAWPATAADMILSASEAPVRNQTENIVTSPMAYNSWWKNLPDEMQLRLAQGDLDTQARLQGLSDTGQLFLDRAGTMNFSNTAPSAATAVTMGGLFSHPIETAKIIASSIGSSALATSPEMAKMMAGRYAVADDPRFTQAMIQALKGTVRATEMEQQQ